MGIWQKRVSALIGFPALFALAACGGETAEAPAEIAENSESAELPEIPLMGPERTILAFGDSLFAGYGLEPGQSYPAKLENALRRQGINAVMVNAGISGDTSSAGLERLEFTLDSQDTKPDLFILELGGNDLLRGISPEETRANFDAMLTELNSRDIPVLIMGMRAPPNYGPEYQAEFDAIYAEMAEKYDTAIIPFWLNDIYKDTDLFQRDRIHPTEEGIEALVASTLDEVAAAIPQEEEGGAG